VRVKALAAHAEAALKIEHDNNVGRGLSQFELDLHGLHATEAVEALDRRLVLFFCAMFTLASGKHTAVYHMHLDHLALIIACLPACDKMIWLHFECQVLSLSPVQMQKESFGKASRTGLNRCLLRRLLCLGQLQHHSQASKLRVIVGRGNNSSGGEASLPRVVESHLLQRNMNYITGQGIITVYLRGLRH